MKLDGAVGYLDPLMTSAERQVREWARKQREAVAKRDEWVVKMRAEGASLRQIARAAGTTAPTIERILRQSREDSS